MESLLSVLMGESHKRDNCLLSCSRNKLLICWNICRTFGSSVDEFQVHQMSHVASLCMQILHSLHVLRWMRIRFLFVHDARRNLTNIQKLRIHSLFLFSCIKWIHMFPVTHFNSTIEISSNRKQTSLCKHAPIILRYHLDIIWLPLKCH